MDNIISFSSERIEEIPRKIESHRETVRRNEPQINNLDREITSLDSLVYSVEARYADQCAQAQARRDEILERNRSNPSILGGFMSVISLVNPPEPPELSRFKADLSAKRSVRNDLEREQRNSKKAISESEKLQEDAYEFTLNFKRDGMKPFIENLKSKLSDFKKKYPIMPSAIRASIDILEDFSKMTDKPGDTVQFSNLAGLLWGIYSSIPNTTENAPFIKKIHGILNKMHVACEDKVTPFGTPITHIDRQRIDSVIETYKQKMDVAFGLYESNKLATHSAALNVVTIIRGLVKEKPDESDHFGYADILQLQYDLLTNKNLENRDYESKKSSFMQYAESLDTMRTYRKLAAVLFIIAIGLILGSTIAAATSTGLIVPMLIVGLVLATLSSIGYFSAKKTAITQAMLQSSSLFDSAPKLDQKQEASQDFSEHKLSSGDAGNK